MNKKSSNNLISINELKKLFPLKNSLETGSKEFPYLDPEFTRQQNLNKNYQVYTSEFIDSLSKYLSNRINVLYEIYSSPITILEVGAGDGRLSKYLYAELLKLAEGKFMIVATDNKNWEKKKRTNTAPKNDVIDMDYNDAIKKYAINPTIIISCWMNVDVDWTEDFRSNKNVLEYILIGDLFRTAYYGKGYFLPKNSDFTSHNLGKENIVNGLLGRFDGSPHNPNSRTVVYTYTRKLA